MDQILSIEAAEERMELEAFCVIMNDACIGMEAYDDEHSNRVVEKVNMCGGRFLMLEDEEVCGLTNDPKEAYRFLKGERDGAES